MTTAGKNLLLRVLVAAVFGPAVIFALYSGGVYLLIFQMAAVFGLSAEFTLLPSVRFRPLRSGFFIASCLAVPLLHWLEWQSFVPAFVLLFSAAWFLLELAERGVDRTIETSAYGVFGLVLFAWAPSLVWELHAVDPLLAVLPMALVWTSDTTAYFAGSWIGGPKMSPTISPNKTWAGFAGGMIGAFIAGLGFRLAWPSVFGLDILFFAPIAGLVAIGGDLFESKVKREMNIKDSSRAIPGHGGWWDRFDSWLFVQLASWVFYILL